MSIRLSIRDAAIAALNVAAKPATVPVVTKRRWLPAGAVPAMAVIFIEEPVDPNRPPGFPLSRRYLTIGVECVEGVSLPELSDDMVEPMLIWAVQALGDTNLGGLAHSIEEQGTTWEAIQGDLFYLRATVRFNISYQTKRDDLTQKQ